MTTVVRERGGDVRDLLRSLSDLSVLESLQDNSKVSYQSGINSWINFCVMLNELIPGCKPPEDQLKVTEDEALWWLALIVKQSTAYSYRTHLKLACALGRESTAWDTVLVKASLRAKLAGNPVDIKTNKWVCQKELLAKMVSHCEVNNMDLVEGHYDSIVCVPVSGLLRVLSDSVL